MLLSAWTGTFQEWPLTATWYDQLNFDAWLLYIGSKPPADAASDFSQFGSNKPAVLQFQTQAWDRVRGREDPNQPDTLATAISTISDIGFFIYVFFFFPNTYSVHYKTPTIY